MFAGPLENHLSLFSVCLHSLIYSFHNEESHIISVSLTLCVAPSKNALTDFNNCNLFIYSKIQPVCRKIKNKNKQPKIKQN